MSWDWVERVVQFFVVAVMGSSAIAIFLLLYMFFSYVFFGVTYR